MTGRLRADSSVCDAGRGRRIGAYMRTVCRKQHWTPEVLAGVLNVDIQYAHALLAGRVSDIPRHHVHTLVQCGAIWSEMMAAFYPTQTPMTRRAIESVMRWFSWRHHRLNAQTHTLYAGNRQRQDPTARVGTIAYGPTSPFARDDKQLSPRRGPSLMAAEFNTVEACGPVRNACLNCGNNLVVEPQSLEDAMLALSEANRWKLRFVFLAATIGYTQLLPEDHEFREQQIDLCHRLDRILKTSLNEIDRREVSEARHSFWSTMRTAVRKGLIDVGKSKGGP
jgi:hypothetical protein